jgi:hypothetical protein
MGNRASSQERTRVKAVKQRLDGKWTWEMPKMLNQPEDAQHKSMSALSTLSALSSPDTQDAQHAQHAQANGVSTLHDH